MEWVIVSEVKVKVKVKVKEWKIFKTIFERFWAERPKKKFVKFEVNSEEFLRVAHPSKQGQWKIFEQIFLRYCIWS